jgi:hypothetical protein
MPDEQRCPRDLVKRLASLFPRCNTEPVDRFCQMVAELPGDVRDEVTKICCIALGWRSDPMEDFLDKLDPVKEMFRPGEMEDMREQFGVVVGKVGVRQEMLIPGLMLYLTLCYRRATLPETTSQGIDEDLKLLERMEAERKKPVEERGAMMTDEVIDSVIPKIKERMGRRLHQREAAQQILQLLEYKWKETFPEEYWLDWLARVMGGAEER